MIGLLTEDDVAQMIGSLSEDCEKDIKYITKFSNDHILDFSIQDLIDSTVTLYRQQWLIELLFEEVLKRGN